ncbi:unnamed protein product, partial [marine sediment metagenome]
LTDSTFGAGKLSLKQTSGAVLYGYGYSIAITASYEQVTMGYMASAAVNSNGIQVGSGTNAESFEDYALQTLIAEGAGAGQLNYAASLAPTKGYAALVFTIAWVRYMNNNSGGNVDVNEVSLVHWGGKTGAKTLQLMARDHLPATVTVPDTGQLKVTYTIQLTYPS